MDSRLGRFGFADKLNPLTAFETWGNVRTGPEYHTDTTLRLESPGNSSLYSSNLTGTKRKWGDTGRKEGLDYTSLALSLGRSRSSSDSRRSSSATMCTMSSAKETNEESSMDLGLNFQLHIGNDSTSIPRDCTADTSKGLSNGHMLDLQLTLSVGAPESVITDMTPVLVQHQASFETSTATIGPELTINEGSTLSCSRYSRHQLHSLAYTSKVSSRFPPNQKSPAKANPVLHPNLSSAVIPTLTSPFASTSGITQQHNKICQFQGCAKGARGGSGLCIAHGGGRRCHKSGCHKGAEGRTIYCKAHGGGRRCDYLGCTKSAEGRTDYCIGHGGGRRCSHEGCTRAARGKSGLCIRHGGGKRCQRENCMKSAEGHYGLCIAHGGGRRCQYQECSKGAQGSTMFCKAHGGGKRCTFSGCNKGAEGSTPFCKGHGGGKRCAFQGGCGKSVHGGTQFCVAHGGGKRCAVSECTKSARGRTDFCVRHGGGKRCKSDGCAKSAQGSTDYCKAHGGGKRCLWGQPGRCDFGVGGPPCDRFSRGKIGLCAAHSALVQDGRVHGETFLGPVTSEHPTPSKSEKKKMKGIVFEQDMLFKRDNGKQGTLMVWNGIDQNKFMHHAMPLQTSVVSLPEGRVHGGSLLAMLATSTASLESQPGSQVGGSTSEQGMRYITVNDLASGWGRSI